MSVYDFTAICLQLAC